MFRQGYLKKDKALQVITPLSCPVWVSAAVERLLGAPFQPMLMHSQQSSVNNCATRCKGQGLTHAVSQKKQSIFSQISAFLDVHLHHDILYSLYLCPSSYLLLCFFGVCFEKRLSVVKL